MVLNRGIAVAKDGTMTLEASEYDPYENKCLTKPPGTIGSVDDDAGKVVRWIMEPFWLAKDRRVIPLSKMQRGHLLNTVQFLRRHVRRNAQEKADQLYDGLMLCRGDGATDCLEGEIRVWEDYTRVVADYDGRPPVPVDEACAAVYEEIGWRHIMAEVDKRGLRGLLPLYAKAEDHKAPTPSYLRVNGTWRKNRRNVRRAFDAFGFERAYKAAAGAKACRAIRKELHRLKRTRSPMVIGTATGRCSWARVAPVSVDEHDPFYPGPYADYRYEAPPSHPRCPTRPRSA